MPDLFELSPIFQNNPLASTTEQNGTAHPLDSSPRRLDCRQGPDPHRFFRSVEQNDPQLSGSSNFMVASHFLMCRKEHPTATASQEGAVLWCYIFLKSNKLIVVWKSFLADLSVSATEYLFFSIYPEYCARQDSVCILRYADSFAYG